jgi:hypothetical protein
MQNYLNRIQNQKLSNKKEDTPDKNFKLNPKSKVDINKLLNRVKLKEKSKKKDNLTLLGIGLAIVSITGLFLFF